MKVDSDGKTPLHKVRFPSKLYPKCVQSHGFKGGGHVSTSS